MSDLSLFHFLRPGWLLLVPLAVILPFLWRKMRRPSGDWARVCDPHLLKWLSVGSSTGKSRGWGAFFAGLAILVAILSLAGPSWVKLPDTSFTARDARVIVLDLSDSMLAQDLKPDRLTQARYRLADLLRGTSEGQTGLVAFAGDAFVVSPLTSDMNTIANLLPALRPDIIPVSGSRADRALELAATLLERAGLGSGEVLLVSDSADDRTAAAARRLRDQGVVVSVLAVGTPGGAPIPNGGGFLSDNSGNVVIARTDIAAMRTVASVGGGQFTTLSTAAGELAPWADRDSGAFERRDEALEERWQDAGPWLVLLLLPILLAGFRRGLLFTLGLVIMPAVMVPQSAQAAWWEDLWARRDQQAYQALEQEQPDLAAALAQDPAIAGEGAYRSGDYTTAAQSWTGIDTASGHYNRGNALALDGDLEGAIAAYDQALQFDPDMHDAIYNKNVVERMKQQQQEQQQNQEGESEQQEGEQQQDQSQSSEQQESEQQDGENQPGDEQEAEANQEEQEGEAERMQREIQEAWQEEDSQAMEQWLRRIPDDPGGLLRRKFRNEYLRRGEQQAEEETW